MRHAEVVTKRETISEEQQGLTWGFQNKTKECRMGEWGRRSKTETELGGGGGVDDLSMFSRSQQQKVFFFLHFISF